MPTITGNEKNNVPTGFNKDVQDLSSVSTLLSSRDNTSIECISKV